MICSHEVPRSSSLSVVNAVLGCSSGIPALPGSYSSGSHIGPSRLHLPSSCSSAAARGHPSSLPTPTPVCLHCQSFHAVCSAKHHQCHPDRAGMMDGSSGFVPQQSTQHPGGHSGRSLQLPRSWTAQMKYRIFQKMARLERWEPSSWRKPSQETIHSFLQLERKEVMSHPALTAGRAKPAVTKHFSECSHLKWHKIMMNRFQWQMEVYYIIQF